MKKIMYLTLLAALPLLANAQAPTLTQADAPTANESYTDVYDSRQGAHQITPPGPGQSWNYANAFVPDDSVVTTFVPVSAVPASYSTNFSSADLAIYYPDDSVAAFFKKNATGFYLDGVGFDPAMSQSLGFSSVNFNPDQMIVPFPFTFGDTRSHTSRMVVEGTFPGAPFPIRFAVTTYQTFSADAHGSLTTPAGTFPSTLRVRQFSYSIDTTYANIGLGWMPVDNNGPQDTTISYTWYRNGPLAMLMTIEEDPFSPGTSTGASYLSNVLVSAPEPLSIAMPFNVYPNPAHNRPVNFEIYQADAQTLVITDMLGRTVQTENVNGLNQLSVSTYSYRSGTYFYTLAAKDGRLLQSGRFVVVK